MIDVTKPLRVVVQGATGRFGRFHALDMLAYGTDIVAGVSPDKAGQAVSRVPIFASVQAARAAAGAIDASVIFVPAPSALAALTEAIDADVKLIVCITEGIPVHDFLRAKQLAAARGAVIVGPNCPGILTAHNKLGIIPTSVARPGATAIVSKSGTLSYAIADGLSQAGCGQRYIIGIGGDPLRGTSYNEWLAVFERDTDVKNIVLIGEIGGHDEQLAAQFIMGHVTKPVFAYVAGHDAPVGQKLGHAGAVVGGADETAQAKTAALAAAGARTFNNLGDLIAALAATRTT
jgi:succinyl-CoA synthetase alpha subunit